MVAARANCLHSDSAGYAEEKEMYTLGYYFSHYQMQASVTLLRDRFH